MAASSAYLLHNLLTRRRDRSNLTHALKPLFFFMPTTLALATTLLILLYISSTSNLFFIHPNHLKNHEIPKLPLSFSPPKFVGKIANFSEMEGGAVLAGAENRSNLELHVGSHGSEMYTNNKELFHDRDIFLKNYKDMCAN